MALKRAAYTRPSLQIAMLRRVGGRGGCDAAQGASPGEAAASADLGDSSKYSNENFED